MPYLLKIRAVRKSISISDVNEMVFLIPFRRFFYVLKIRLSNVSVCLAVTGGHTRPTTYTNV